MKTLFNNVLKSGTSAIVLLATVLTLNASAATVDNPLATGKTATVNFGHATADIKKVIVTGNTKVILVQSKNEFVTMDSTDLQKVSVKQIGNALTISSNERNPVVVTVYVKNPYRIDASGKAEVRTLGKFDLVNLQVMLKDEATAKVKANTQSIYTVINDRANLQLLGTTGKHIYERADIAKMDTAKFAAVETENARSLTEVVALNIKGRNK
jgi:putative autotransporter adhesin-like protein